MTGREAADRGAGNDRPLAETDPAIVAAMSLDGDPVALRRYYDRWAGDYDADVGAERYELPEQVAVLIDEVVTGNGAEPIDGLAVDLGPPGAEVLDVGCGTGLVGLRLAEAGYRHIDGIDLSPAMTERAAARGCYRSLTAGVDITAPLPPALTGRYDLVVAGGVFTVGHVPPDTLAAVATLARPGGLLVVSTRQQYYDETDYQAVSDRLEADGALRLVQVNRRAPYTVDSRGDYWAYLVTGGRPVGPGASREP